MICKGVETVKQFNMQIYQNLLNNSSGVTRENLFILLGAVQDTFGYVPREVIRDLAASTGVAEARLYGAVTSYGEFKIESEANG